jgi:hypothetical protein
MHEPQANNCQHPHCKCSLDDERRVVQREGHSYCSERCADQRGCDHHGCNCGVFPLEEPAQPPA